MRNLSLLPRLLIARPNWTLWKMTDCCRLTGYFLNRFSQQNRINNWPEKSFGELIVFDSLMNICVLNIQTIKLTPSATCSMRDNILCHKTFFLTVPFTMWSVVSSSVVSQVSIEINIWAWKYLKYGIIRAAANVGFLVAGLQKL